MRDENKLSHIVILKGEINLRSQTVSSSEHAVAEGISPMEVQGFCE